MSPLSISAKTGSLYFSEKNPEVQAFENMKAGKTSLGFKEKICAFVSWLTCVYNPLDLDAGVVQLLGEGVHGLHQILTGLWVNVGPPCWDLDWKSKGKERLEACFFFLFEFHKIQQGTFGSMLFNTSEYNRKHLYTDQSPATKRPHEADKRKLSHSDTI